MDTRSARRPALQDNGGPRPRSASKPEEARLTLLSPAHEQYSLAPDCGSFLAAH